MIMGLFSRKVYDGYSRYPLWKKGGVCDVCNKPLANETAYVVPRKDFWESTIYRDRTIQSRYFEAKSNPALADFSDEKIRQVVIALFQQQASKDKTPSAVCKNCIYMFDSGCSKPKSSFAKKPPSEPLDDEWLEKTAHSPTGVLTLGYLSTPNIDPEDAWKKIQETIMIKIVKEFSSSPEEAEAKFDAVMDRIIYLRDKGKLKSVLE